jgi:hypothetical protein
MPGPIGELGAVGVLEEPADFFFLLFFRRPFFPLASASAKAALPASPRESAANSPRPKPATTPRREAPVA